MANSNLTNIQALELYRVALENATAQPEIAKLMAELGYDAKEIAKGKKILEETRKAYDFKQKEDDETTQAYADYSEKRDELSETYSLHRKKGKVVFRNDLETLKQLELTGSLSQSYLKWFETVKKFYNVANESEEIQNKLKRLKITKEEIADALKLTNELNQVRAAYLREKGESEDATKEKNQAFDVIDDWMSEFYAVAKIALEDNPQLLEVLGKKVIS